MNKLETMETLYKVLNMLKVFFKSAIILRSNIKNIISNIEKTILVLINNVLN